MKNLITCLVVCVLSGATFATTWTVDDSGGADFYDIQSAVNAASDGDEIIVYPGTYTNTGDNVVDMMGKRVWLHSSDGPGTTIIDGEDARRVILCNSGETSQTKIEGFTITRGYTSSSLDGLLSPLASNDFDGEGRIVWDADPGFPIEGGIRGLPGLGGGIYTDASPTITNCIISRNWCSSIGGGLDLRGPNCAATITACTISNNISGFDVGGLCCFDSYPTITNCLITENSAERVGGLLVANTATITNCIIRNNSEVPSYTGGVYFYGVSCTMSETTICGNTQPQIYGEYTDGGGNTVADTCSGDPTGACCVGTSCSTGTAADCTAAGGTYLGDGSSCSGDPCGSNCPGDTNGDGYVDVSDLLAVIDQWGLTGSPADINGDGIVDVSDLLIVVGNWGPCGAGSTVWTVDDDAGADFYYIQDAVDAASDGDEILVYPGTYTSSGDNVVDMMGKALWLHSSDGPETTIIDGEDVRRGILCGSGETSKTIIEGFTITNGYSDGGGGMFNSNSNPTLTNCIFTGNSCNPNSGGGMLNNNSSPTLTNCTFTENTADWRGGGMYNTESNPTLTNCTFTNNSAVIDGGGMRNWNSSPTLTDCTFTGNTAGSLGGGIANDNGATPVLYGCTVCDNTPDQIYGNWTDGGGNTVADTCSGDPTGACCVGTSCSIGTDADCSAAGGTYLGDGSSCSGDPCGGGSNVWTVDDSGGADFYDIQSAVNAASDGDEILVYPGTYTSTQVAHVVDMMGKSVWLHSSNGPEMTIIDGQGARRGIVCTNAETNLTEIEGFTLTNGLAVEFDYNGNGSVDTWEDNGGGMLCWASSPTVTHCMFTNNSTENTFHNGAGMALDLSSPILTDCEFDSNTSFYAGGGMHCYNNSHPVLNNCTIKNNTAPGYGGGGMRNSTSSSPTLIDTTVCDNTPDQISGGWTDGGGNYVADTCSGDPTGACCVDTSCSTGTAADCSAAGGTYLGDGSTCSGDPCGGGGGSVDCACDAQYSVGDRVVSLVDNPDGQGKIWIGSEGTVVCGASNNPLDLAILVEWDDIAGGHDGNGYCECGNTDPLPSSSRWWVMCEWIAPTGTTTGACCVGTSCSIGTAADCSAAGGTYLGDGSSCSGDPCGAGSNVWTVDDSGGADFYDIQSAVNVASDGDEIIVYPGTYTDTGVAVVDMMGKRVWLHSSEGPETTIINGEDVRRGIACVTAETSVTVIEGFTITRGSTVNLLKGAYNNGGGMICENSSPTLTNCVFTNNTTSFTGQNGGGLANHGSSPALTNCVFDGNTSATAGGGMYNAINSSPTLTNCTFRNNASLGGTGGGGMKNGDGCNPTLTNCIIENNTSATNGGGMYNSGSPPTLTDTVVCGNTPNQIYGGWVDGGGNTVADTCQK